MSIVIWAVLILSSVLAAAVIFLSSKNCGIRDRERTQVGRLAKDADRSVSTEHARARRAMNRAAGQEWRNRFE